MRETQASVSILGTLLAVAVLVGDGRAAPVIDCLTAPPGGTYFSFETSPIAPGFFDPGSDGFSGAVALQGAWIDQPVFGDTSMIIERQDRVTPSMPSEVHVVDIQVMAMSLAGSQPITVTYGGGSPELWSVRTALAQPGVSGVCPPTGCGTMTFTAGPTGWTMGAFLEFDVVVPIKFIFERQAPGAAAERQLVLPGGLELSATDIPWDIGIGAAAPPCGGAWEVIVDAGEMIDADGDGVVDTTLPTTELGWLLIGAPGWTRVWNISYGVGAHAAHQFRLAWGGDICWPARPAPAATARPRVGLVDPFASIVTVGSVGQEVVVVVENDGMQAMSVDSLGLVFTGQVSGMDRSTDYTVTPYPANPTQLGALEADLWRYTVDIAPGAVTEPIEIQAPLTGTDLVSGLPADDPTADTPGIWLYPGCSVLAPATGAAVSSVVPVQISAQVPSGGQMTARFEYSTDAGVTWQPATDAGTGSLTGSPTAAFAGGVHSWDWQSTADIVDQALGLVLRVELTEVGSGTIRDCTTIVDVLNRPTCTLVLWGTGPASQDTVFALVPTSEHLQPLSAAFHYSTNSGASWNLATPVGGFTNPLTGLTSGQQALFAWDTVADSLGIVTLAAGVLMRATVTDGVSPTPVECMTPWFDVDNRPTSCLVGLSGASPVAGDIPIVIQPTSPRAGALQATIGYSTDAGLTWQMATPAGTYTNPRTGLSSGQIAAFAWHSFADGVARFGPHTGVVLRAWVSDSLPVPPSTCTSSPFTVDNREPTCVLLALAASPAGGDVPFEVTADSFTFRPLDATFSYSTDGGATWTLATPSGTFTNPIPGIPSGVPALFEWDSYADGVGLVTPATNTQLRAIVDDGGPLTLGLCVSGTFTIDNRPPTCTLLRLALSPVGGDVPFEVVPSSAAFGTLDGAFEFSTDSGATWVMASPAATFTNPLLGLPSGQPSLFEWNSFADGVGLGGPVVGVTFRAHVTAAIPGQGTCVTSSFTVDNRQPTCSLQRLALSPVAGDAPFEVLPASPLGQPIEATFDFSTDLGLTWIRATASVASANPLAGIPSGQAAAFEWDTLADGVGVGTLIPGVILRASVRDAGLPSPGFCQTIPFSVENPCLCGDCNGNGLAAEILDALASAKIAAGIDVATPAQLVCCDTDGSGFVTVIDALAQAQVAAGLPVVLSCQ